MEIIQLLLKSGTYINTIDIYRCTALHYIAQQHGNGNVKVMRWLLDMGADNNVRDKNGRTALQYLDIFYSFDEETIRLLTSSNK